jgi:hypothetical protein
MSMPGPESRDGDGDLGMYVLYRPPSELTSPCQRPHGEEKGRAWGSGPRVDESVFGTQSTIDMFSTYRGNRVATDPGKNSKDPGKNSKDPGKNSNED